MGVSGTDVRLGPEGLCVARNMRLEVKGYRSKVMMSLAVYSVNDDYEKEQHDSMNAYYRIHPVPKVGIAKLAIPLNAQSPIVRFSKFPN